MMSEKGTLQQIEFTIYGRPAPKGSKGAMLRGGKIILFESNKNQRPFEQLVTRQTIKQLPRTWEPIKNKSVKVELVFRLRKPKTSKNDVMIVAPDVDKLCRNVLDALTKAGVYGDDCQVNHLIALKEYESGVVREGVRIKISWIS